MVTKHCEAVKYGIKVWPRDCNPFSSLSGKKRWSFLRAFVRLHVLTHIHSACVLSYYVCAQAFVQLSCAELYPVYWENSKQSAISPQPSQALTVTQRTAQNTCWDDGDGLQPRQHMGLILVLMKTTWHKYRTKRPTLETCAVPLQRCWHRRKHLIILEVLRQEEAWRDNDTGSVMRYV